MSRYPLTLAVVIGSLTHLLVQATDVTLGRPGSPVMLAAAAKGMTRAAPREKDFLPGTLAPIREGLVTCATLANTATIRVTTGVRRRTGRSIT